MNRNEFVKYCLAGATLAYFPVKLFGGKTSNLPNILLIGDSISIGYTPFVQELLKGKANVFRPMLEDGKPENCDGSKNGVTNIERWIGGKKWDVIHFNFGLHDIKHVDPQTGVATMNPNDPLQSDIKQYANNLKLILGRLKTTSAKLIFATTTPVPNKRVSPLREPENVIKYNKAAIRIMRKEHVDVNDLYSFVLPKVTEIQRPNNVHFGEEGSRLLAEEVVLKLLPWIHA